MVSLPLYYLNHLKDVCDSLNKIFPCKIYFYIYFLVSSKVKKDSESEVTLVLVRLYDFCTTQNKDQKTTSSRKLHDWLDVSRPFCFSIFYFVNIPH